MHLVVCPHCWRQLKLAKSGAEFPAGAVTCRYCGAIFTAEVLEVPDDAAMPTAQEVYQHLRMEYDSSHLYQQPEIVAEEPAVEQTQAAEETAAPADEANETPETTTLSEEQLAEQIKQAAQNVEEISQLAEDSEAAPPAEPDFNDTAADTPHERKTAAFAAGGTGSDDIETDEPKIGKRPDAPTPVQPPAEPKNEAAKLVPTEPVPVAIPVKDAPAEKTEEIQPQPVPVEVDKPAKKPSAQPKPVTNHKVAAKNFMSQSRPSEPIELKDEEIMLADDNDEPQPAAPAATEPVAEPVPVEYNPVKSEDSADALTALEVEHDKPAEPVLVDAAPHKHHIKRRKKTGWPMVAAIFIIIAGCLYGIYAGATMVLDRQKKNVDLQAQIKADIEKAAAQKPKATLLDANEDDDMVLIDDANIIDIAQLKDGGPDQRAAFTGTFRSGKKTSMDIARVELTLSNANGETIKLKSNSYKNIPAGSEIMFSVISDSTVTGKLNLQNKVVKGQKASPDTVGWNIIGFTRENKNGMINVFGQTKNPTNQTVHNIYIWCDFFTSDGLFAGSAKGTLPAEAVELTPGSKVSYNIKFDTESSSAFMPEAVQFIRPRLIGKKAE